jgi:hypothetical protein
MYYTLELAYIKALGALGHQALARDGNASPASLSTAKAINRGGRVTMSRWSFPVLPSVRFVVPVRIPGTVVPGIVKRKINVQGIGAKDL